MAQADCNLRKSTFPGQIKIEKISAISSDEYQKNYLFIENKNFISFAISITYCPTDCNILILFAVLSVSPTFTLFIIQELCFLEWYDYMTLILLLT